MHLRNSSNNVIYLPESNLYRRAGSSGGAQLKFKVNNLWYKLDAYNYSALAEVICCYLARRLCFPYNIVNYSLCIVNYDGINFLATVSEDFTKGTQEVSLYNLWLSYTGFDFHTGIQLNTELSAKDKIAYTLECIKAMTDLSGVEQYLSDLIAFDYIVCNRDRHSRNIVFLEDNFKFSFLGLFDCGDSLLSDLNLFPMRDEDMYSQVKYYMSKVKFKPFSTSGATQFKLLKELAQPWVLSVVKSPRDIFDILGDVYNCIANDLDALDLDNLDKVDLLNYASRCISILKLQLNKLL